MNPPPGAGPPPAGESQSRTAIDTRPSRSPCWGVVSHPVFDNRLADATKESRGAQPARSETTSARSRAWRQVRVVPHPHSCTAQDIVDTEADFGLRPVPHGNPAGSLLTADRKTGTIG